MLMKKYYFLLLLIQGCNDLDAKKPEDPEIEVELEQE